VLHNSKIASLKWMLPQRRGEAVHGRQGFSHVVRIGVIWSGLALGLGPALAQSPSDLGRVVYTKANCVDCHKWHGGGGGG